jgi:poly(3-hydroxybutyrate) depolymerase
MRHLLAVLLTLSCPLAHAQAQDRPGAVVKGEVESGGRKRTYHLFVPAGAAAPAGRAPARALPLVVVFHGSGQGGAALVEPWTALAAREGFIVAGPDSADPSKWSTPADGPEFVRDLVEHLKARHPVSARRVYLFGYSAGSGFVINISLLESRYFAAAAVFASATFSRQYASAAERRIPFLIRAGADDEVFALRDVKATAKGLSGLGFPVEFGELAGRGHNYYRVAAELNEEVWRFFSRHELKEEPDYRHYEFKR